MRSFRHGGIRLAYDVVGDGPAVVLHTGAGGDSRMWRRAGHVDGLQREGFRVVLFDHRGHGASEAPLDPAAYSVESFTADVEALAGELDLSRFVFWGYSDGARVGYELAATHPERVLALVASGGVDDLDEDPDEWHSAAQVVREQGLEALLEDEPAPDWLVTQLVDDTDAEVVARELDGFAGWSPWSVFPRIQAPTLIVAGEHEAENVEAAAAAIRLGRALILPGLGHLGAFVASALVLGFVCEFLHGALEREVTGDE